MKTAGIVADNYKLDKFKEKLEANGFLEYTITPYTLGGVKDVSLIKVEVPDYQVNEVYKICQEVELHFKRSN